MTAKNTEQTPPLAEVDSSGFVRLTWKQKAILWEKCADVLATAVEHYRGKDREHGYPSKAVQGYWLVNYPAHKGAGLATH
jgi:hypothetical protein